MKSVVQSKTPRRYRTRLLNDKVQTARRHQENPNGQTGINRQDPRTQNYVNDNYTYTFNEVQSSRERQNSYGQDSFIDTIDGFTTTSSNQGYTWDEEEGGEDFFQELVFPPNGSFTHRNESQGKNVYADVNSKRMPQTARRLPQKGRLNSTIPNLPPLAGNTWGKAHRGKNENTMSGNVGVRGRRRNDLIGGYYPRDVQPMGSEDARRDSNTSTASSFASSLRSPGPLSSFLSSRRSSEASTSQRSIIQSPYEYDISGNQPFHAAGAIVNDRIQRDNRISGGPLYGASLTKFLNAAAARRRESYDSVPSRTPLPHEIPNNDLRRASDPEHVGGGRTTMRGGRGDRSTTGGSTQPFHRCQSLNAFRPLPIPKSMSTLAQTEGFLGQGNYVEREANNFMSSCSSIATNCTSEGVASEDEHQIRDARTGIDEALVDLHLAADSFQNDVMIPDEMGAFLEQQQWATTILEDTVEEEQNADMKFADIFPAIKKSVSGGHLSGDCQIDTGSQRLSRSVGVEGNGERYDKFLHKTIDGHSNLLVAYQRESLNDESWMGVNSDYSANDQNQNGDLIGVGFRTNDAYGTESYAVGQPIQFQVASRNQSTLSSVISSNTLMNENGQTLNDLQQRQAHLTWLQNQEQQQLLWQQREEQQQLARRQKEQQERILQQQQQHQQLLWQQSQQQQHMNWIQQEQQILAWQEKHNKKLQEQQQHQLYRQRQMQEQQKLVDAQSLTQSSSLHFNSERDCFDQIVDFDLTAYQDGRKMCAQSDILTFMDQNNNQKLEQLQEIVAGNDETFPASSAPKSLDSLSTINDAQLTDVFNSICAEPISFMDSLASLNMDPTVISANMSVSESGGSRRSSTMTTPRPSLLFET